MGAPGWHPLFVGWLPYDPFLAVSIVPDHLGNIPQSDSHDRQWLFIQPPGVFPVDQFLFSLKGHLAGVLFPGWHGSLPNGNHAGGTLGTRFGVDGFLDLVDGTDNVVLFLEAFPES